MGFFSQEIYIPGSIYKLLPLLYAVAGLFMWLILDHGIARMAGLALVVFALFITMKRLRKPGDR